MSGKCYLDTKAVAVKVAVKEESKSERNEGVKFKSLVNRIRGFVFCILSFSLALSLWYSENLLQDATFVSICMVGPDRYKEVQA